MPRDLRVEFPGATCRLAGFNSALPHEPSRVGIELKESGVTARPAFQRGFNATINES